MKQPTKQPMKHQMKQSTTQQARVSMPKRTQTVRKQKTGLIAASVLCFSIAGHYTGFGILSHLSKDGTVSAWTIVLAVCLAGLGIGGICTALFGLSPKISWRAVAKPLLMLGVCYVLLQLQLSVLAGGVSVVLSSVGGVSGSGVKIAADLLSAVLQIPMQAGAMLLLLYILTGKEFRFGRLYVKAMAAYSVYTLLLWTAGLTGTSIWALLFRVCLSTALTCVLWMYVYQIYQKGEPSHETETQA